MIYETLLIRFCPFCENQVKYKPNKDKLFKCPYCNYECECYEITTMINAKNFTKEMEILNKQLLVVTQKINQMEDLLEIYGEYEDSV